MYSRCRVDLSPCRTDRFPGSSSGQDRELKRARARCPRQASEAPRHPTRYFGVRQHARAWRFGVFCTFAEDGSRWSRRPFQVAGLAPSRYPRTLADPTHRLDAATQREARPHFVAQMGSSTFITKPVSTAADSQMPEHRGRIRLERCGPLPSMLCVFSAHLIGSDVGRGALVEGHQVRSGEPALALV